MSTIAAKTNGSLARIANPPPLAQHSHRFEIEIPLHTITPSGFEEPASKRKKWPSRLFFLFFIAITVGYGWAHPWYTWDMLGYVGTALSIDNDNVDQVHSLTYASAGKYLPKKEFDDLTTKSSDAVSAEYKADMTVNSQHFAEQFPYLRVKPLYVFLLFALMKTGIDPIHADVLISSLATALLCIIILKWVRNYLKPSIAVVVASALLLLAGILEFSGITTPDALSALLVVSAFYYASVTKEHWRTVGLLILATLVRADNAPLIFFYLFYAKFIAPKKISWEGAISAGTLAIAIFFAIEKWAGFYGWNVHFYHSFVHRLVDPVHFTGTVSLAQYLTAVVLELRMKPPCNMNWFFIGLAIAGILIAKPGSLGKNVLFHLTSISGIAFVLHCLLFPEPGPRFFFAYFLVVGIFFIDQVRRVKRTGWQRKPVRRRHFIPAT